MGKIIILDENTSNKIAAGEVIERPASVVKELVENSIDAGAGSITVEIKNGGISYIKVSDNGSGIDEDDAEIAFERHATSKIRNANDLEAIATLGFRGEALASIAAVSTVELTSRVQKNPHGTYVKIQGGVTKEVKQAGCPVGTTFIIRDLFFNTPARFKFLKKDSTEASYISEVITRMALGNPQISFRLISNNSTVLHTPGNNDLLSTIFSIYGKETAKEVCEINYSDNKVRITGYAGKPEIARSNRNQQSLFINGRYVKSKIVTSAIDEAYKTYLMKNKFPFIVMNIAVNPLLVDVNVHPTKMEIRFSDDQEMFRCVYHAINNALLGMSLIKEVDLGVKKESPFKFAPYNSPGVEYIQQKFELDRSFVRETPRKEEKAPKQSGVFTPVSGQMDLKPKLPETKLFPEKEEKKNVQPVCAAPGETIKTDERIETENTGAQIRVQNAMELPAKIPDIPAGAEEQHKDNALVSIFEEARIIGQAFSTYILLQHGEELILIDQHAAHERILFEQLKLKYRNEESLSQMLLSPVVIELTCQEIKLLEEYKEFFNKLGFIFDNFGNNSVILRSIPYALDNASSKELFLEVVDHIVNTGKKEYKTIEEDTLYTIACKAAVKANRRLDEVEIKEVLKGLSDIGNPYTCPHGRPTLIKITKYELEKKFKRIV